MYYAFVELTNNLSNRSSLILPNSYLNNVSAKKLRKLIQANVSFIRDFKESKQFDTASPYTTILMLNKKDTDMFSYAKYESREDTRLSEIADLYAGISTNADKLFLIDKSTLGQGYYKKIYG